MEKQPSERTKYWITVVTVLMIVAFLFYLVSYWVLVESLLVTGVLQ